MYKVTNYMTAKALRKAVRDGKFVRLKNVAAKVFSHYDENKRACMIDTPFPADGVLHTITGPYNNQCRQFEVSVVTFDGVIEEVK